MESAGSREHLQFAEAIGIATTVAALSVVGLRGLVELGLILSLAACLVQAAPRLNDLKARRLKRLCWPPWFLVSVIATLALGGLAIATAAQPSTPEYRGRFSNSFSEGQKLWFWLAEREGQVVYINFRVPTFFADSRPLYIEVETYDDPDSKYERVHTGVIYIKCEPGEISGRCLNYGIDVLRPPSHLLDQLWYAHGDHYLQGYFAVDAPTVEHMRFRHISLRPVGAEDAGSKTVR